MYDGIQLEKQKIPVAVIITDLFTSTAKMVALISGIPSYPFVSIPHPIGRLEKDELKERAIEATPQVIKLLLNK